MEFFSNFSPDDKCAFIPMVKQQQSECLSDEEREGTIVAVRFTKPKIWYDIVDEYSGTLFRDVASENVFLSMWAPDPNRKVMPEVQESDLIETPDK